MQKKTTHSTTAPRRATARALDAERILQRAVDVADALRFTVDRARAGKLPLTTAARMCGPFVSAFEAGGSGRKESALNKHWATVSQRDMVAMFNEPLVALLEHTVAELRRQRATRTDDGLQLAREILSNAQLLSPYASLTATDWATMPIWRRVPLHWSDMIVVELVGFDGAIADDRRIDVKSAARRILGKQFGLTPTAVRDRLRGK